MFRSFDITIMAIMVSCVIRKELTLKKLKFNLECSTLCN